MRSRDEEESLIPVYQIGGVFPFQQGIPATVCLKRLFDKLVDAETSASATAALSGFSEILRIPAQNLQGSDFSGEKSAPVAAVHAAAAIGIRGARILLVLSLRFFDSLGGGFPFQQGIPAIFMGK